MGGRPAVEVGQTIGPLTRVVSRVSICRYAAASGDFNPIHLDDDFARKAGLPGVIAHGMYSYGLAGKLLVDWTGGTEAIRSLSIRFGRLVRPGEALTVSGQVVAVSEEQGEPVVKVALSCRNQAGEEIWKKATAEVRPDK